MNQRQWIILALLGILAMIIFVSPFLGKLSGPALTEGVTSRYPMNFIGSLGETARLDISGNAAIFTVTNSAGVTTRYTPRAEVALLSARLQNKFDGPNGMHADVFLNDNSVVLQDKSGTRRTLYLDGHQPSSSSSSSSGSSSTSDNYNHFSGTSLPTMYYAPDESTAQLMQVGGSPDTLHVTAPHGSFGGDYRRDSNNIFQGPHGNTARILLDTSSNRYVVRLTSYPSGHVTVFTTQHPTSVYRGYDATMNHGSGNERHTDYNSAWNTISTRQQQQQQSTGGRSYDASAYYNSNPRGIPKSKIPPGEEDRYILKTEVVPPVCPSCPSPIVKCKDKSKNNGTCPPCPACARCPQAAFECKKVPTYSSFDADHLPVPVLNDFSTFGM